MNVLLSMLDLRVKAFQSLSLGVIGNVGQTK